MGDSMFNIGDLVTRKSYDNDIIFKIIDIDTNTVAKLLIFYRLTKLMPKNPHNTAVTVHKHEKMCNKRSPITASSTPFTPAFRLQSLYIIR